MWFFRAVALDLDGTLTENDRLADAGIAAVRASRENLKMILVTGRIFDDLEAAYPGLWSEFDAVIAENGAVLHTRSDMRLLASPVDPAVQPALASRGIAARAGRVLLAVAGDDAAAATGVLADLGLDHQVVHNRGAEPSWDPGPSSSGQETPNQPAGTRGTSAPPARPPCWRCRCCPF